MCGSVTEVERFSRECFPAIPPFTVTIKDDSKTYIMDMVQIFPTASEIISLQEKRPVKCGPKERQ